MTKVEELATAVPVQSTRVRVLIADDQADVREALRLLLKAEGYFTETVNNPAALLEALQSNDFDIVLMDLQLPGASGLEAIRTLRASYPELPVVAVSSSEDKRTVLETLDAGAMGFVPKSSTSAVLKAALKLIMSKGIYLPPSVFLADAGGRWDEIGYTHAVSQPRLRRVTPETLGLTPRRRRSTSRESGADARRFAFSGSLQ